MPNEAGTHQLEASDGEHRGDLLSGTSGTGMSISIWVRSGEVDMLTIIPFLHNADKDAVSSVILEAYTIDNVYRSSLRLA